MAPLFSKADLNKFWLDVHNEVTLICAKFGKDLFSISKVISRKTKWPRFLAYPVYATTSEQLEEILKVGRLIRKDQRSRSPKHRIHTYVYYRMAAQTCWI